MTIVIRRRRKHGGGIPGGLRSSWSQVRLGLGARCPDGKTDCKAVWTREARPPGGMPR